MKLRLLCLAIALAGFSGGVLSAPARSVTLGIGMYKVDAEVADTEQSRETGLMFRKSLAPNAGMLFVFEESQPYCFWMKNTLIPLSVAFIDDAGVIVNIEDMKPQSEVNHCAAAPVRYALEMNQGWFRAKGVKAGHRFQGLMAGLGR